MTPSRSRAWSERTRAKVGVETDIIRVHVLNPVAGMPPFKFHAIDIA
jgi:hypothetical protein